MFLGTGIKLPTTKPKLLTTFPPKQDQCQINLETLQRRYGFPSESIDILVCSCIHRLSLVPPSLLMRRSRMSTSKETTSSCLFYFSCFLASIFSQHMACLEAFILTAASHLDASMQNAAIEFLMVPSALMPQFKSICMDRQTTRCH